jgi:hypothetical protein
MNAIMEQYLRVFINYQQDNWMSWLLMAEFVSNNHTSKTTWCSLFFHNYGLHSKMTVRQHPVQNGNDIREVYANTLPQEIAEVCEQMKTEMSRAQSIHAEQAHKHQ